MARTTKARLIDAKIRIIRIGRRFFGHRIILLERWSGRQSYGLKGLDDKVRDIMQAKNGFYVELGANDGRSQSNTLQLELFDGWRGVLIEPVPNIFRKLTFNRSRRRNHLANVGCVSEAFPSKTLRIAEANLMSVPLDVDSDLLNPLEHARRGREIQSGYSESKQEEIIEVPGVTLTTVLDDAHAPAVIDFLSLDVEGGELEVLNGLNFDRYKFRWILVESRSPDQLKKFMSKRNYFFVQALSSHDLLFSSGPTST